MSTGYCWRQRADRDPKACDKSKCCYEASAQAVFDYWKFANSDEWKEMVKRELAKERAKHG